MLTDQKPMLADETSRKYESTRAMLLAYGRGEAEPRRVVADMCEEREALFPEASASTCAKLFLQLREWLLKAALQLASELETKYKYEGGELTSKREQLFRVIEEVTALRLEAVKLPMIIPAVHSILRQQSMGRLWDIVAGYVDEMFPRDSGDTERLSLDGALKKRFGPALTIMPFCEGGNDKHLLDQMLNMVTEGRPSVRIRPAYDFFQVVFAARCIGKWIQRIQAGGVLEDAVQEHKRRAAELSEVLTAREAAAARDAAPASKIKIGDRVLLTNADHDDHGRYATVLKEFVMKKSGKRKWRVQLEGDEQFMVPADQLHPAPKKARLTC